MNTPLDVELAEDRRDVVVDRTRRDEQPLGDLGVPEPVDEKGKHIELAGRDVVVRRAYCTSRVPQMCPNCPRVQHADNDKVSICRYFIQAF